MTIFVVYVFLFGIITFIVGAAVSGRAVDFVDASDPYLQSRLKRSAYFGAFVGCITADLISSAYVLGIAAGAIGGLASYAGSANSEEFGIFVFIKMAQHLIVLTTVAFAVSAAACWANLAHFSAREAAGLPTRPVAPTPTAASSKFCHQCGTLMGTQTKFCPQCGTEDLIAS